MKENKNRLWTRSFFMLWQGQLVSTLGNAVYSIALGFWILEVTGSTALMGILMAASTLPGVLVSPFAGVLVDRFNRKYILILMDMIRAAAIILLAIAAYTNHIKIWMVFAAGILLSICGAVFNPGVQASIPDLVPKSKVENANSAFSVVSTGANMIGSVAGGFLFQTFGAPLLFLFDGLSFLFSGASMPFVNIPVNSKREKINFMDDMAQGFKFMWHQKGLRIILILAAFLNFFAFIGITLFLPFCKYTPYLGAGRYGVLMGCYMAGAMGGFMVLSIVTLKNKHKFAAFVITNIISDFSLIIAINQPIFILMVILLFIAGFANSVYNVILISSVQSSTPQEVRGKVMSFLSMITQGLTPLAMAFGGVLGGLLPIKLVISISFFMVFAISFFAFLSKDFREYIVPAEAQPVKCTENLSEDIY